MRTNPIHIALSSDENYFEGLLTTAWSIARNCSRAHDLVFHILDGGISETNWQFLKSRLSRYNCSVCRHTIDQQKHFGSFRTYHGTGRMAYARLILPDLLPDVDSTIYSDVDIVWIADIAELWDELDPNAIIHCTPSRHTIKAELDWFEKHGYKFEFGKRFCSGMIAMNLAKFRKESLHVKMLDAIAASNGNVPCVDETVLNALTFWRNDRAYLDGRWQHMSYGRTTPLEANGFTLHFGTDAPWQSIHKYHHLLTDQHIIWHRFHAEARQISVWRSMRMPNGVLDIILCRTLFLAARYCGLVRGLLRLVLTLTGKRGNISALNLYMLPFDTRNVNRKLLP